MHIAITLDALDIQQAVASSIEERLGVEADVTVTQGSDGSYCITAGMGNAASKPVKTRKRRTPAEIAADAQTTAPTEPVEAPVTEVLPTTVEVAEVSAEALVAGYADTSVEDTDAAPLFGSDSLFAQ